MQDSLQNLPPLREVVQKYGLSAQKKLGQNFLFDLNITDRIARAAGELAETTVIEIGPGPGGLTRSLLKAGAKQVIAIEKDKRCIEALKEIEKVSDGCLKIFEADALKINYSALEGAPFKVVANLPYNVATVLLLKWFETPQLFKSFTLMFQKEVAERLIAKPRTKAYGRLSVLTQWLMEAKILFDLPPEVFTPSPKVTSSVIHLVPRSTPLVEVSQEALEEVLKVAFNQRRKMLKGSLKNLKVCKEQEISPSALLKRAGIAETLRPEDLSVEEFCALANALHS